jgi:hypothetical protein
MPFGKHIILFLHRGTVDVFLYSFGLKEPKHVKTLTLSEIENSDIEHILKEYQSASVHILLDDDLCYSAAIPLADSFKQKSFSTHDATLNNHIYQQAQLLIPDEFEQESLQITYIDWQKKTATILVPVQKQYTVLAQLLAENEMNVAYFSSVSIAQKKHKNPGIGIVLLATKNESYFRRVFNSLMSVLGVPHIYHTFAIFLLTFFILGVTTSAALTVIGYSLHSQGKLPAIFSGSNLLPRQDPLNSTSDQELLPDVNSIENSTSSSNLNVDNQVSTPIQLPFNPQEVTISVLNGSGIAGKAAQAAAELKKVGFTQISTGNTSLNQSQISDANQMEYSVSLKSEFQDSTEIIAVLERVLEVDPSSIQFDLPDESDSDLVLVILK